ncbi:hypothetical protein [Agromyces cerinus]|uniref:Uncharacterized protein n=1 Tax=Agromyces cerinus subsp. cerinus TaxID=232089 RepID=A0A1N6DPA7_9MICO|nr:hypothetical protein [Agromyces cerinus]SIN72514.1 hypothetical protein SAMN05443544_0542 [Agromyces cerinus subsp. cerinus]
MIKSIEDLRIDAEFADSLVAYHQAARDYHTAEAAKSQVDYIHALEARTKAHNALLAYEGAAS